MGLWVRSNPEKVEINMSGSVCSSGLAIMMNVGLSKIKVPIFNLQDTATVIRQRKLCKSSHFSTELFKYLIHSEYKLNINIFNISRKDTQLKWN